MFTRRRVYAVVVSIAAILTILAVHFVLKEYYPFIYWGVPNIQKNEKYFAIPAGILVGNFLRLYLKSEHFTRLVEFQFTRLMLVRIGFVAAAAVAILVAISR